MSKKSKYVSREVNSNGLINWSEGENHIWKRLITDQVKKIQNKVCDEYLQGLKVLNLPHDRIPQLHEIDSVLKPRTGWTVEPVPCLISFDEFFDLLADRKFCEGMLEHTLRKLEDDKFEAIGNGRPNRTDPGQDN